MIIRSKKYFSLTLMGLCTSVMFACTEQSNHKSSTDEQTKTRQIVKEDSLLLHVESPDWRDQIIYFVMIDRFQDGDKTNNDQGHNLYRPTEEHYYSGGDIQGIIDRIDYVKNLGATTIWLTPPNANLWWSNSSHGTGYHGYWARDFKSVDEHYGDLETYKNLSSQLHKNDMYLIQDVVPNHVGRFFEYQGQFDPLNTDLNFKLISGNLPTERPTQFPFNQIDRHNPKDEKAHIYHWTPEITDFYNQNQEYTYQLSGLNDLNTSNTQVRESLKDSFGYWIKEVGVDAFRLDTAKFMEPEFLNDFIHSDNGIVATAKQTGRDSFPVFGEVFETSLPFEDKAERKIQRFIGTEAQPGLNGIIGFPLYKTVENVFRSGQATSEIGYRIKKQMEMYADPFMVLNFIDNHDVKRFQSAGNTSTVKQAIAFIMTAPGIPAIYQGDEQELLETREAMFAGGFHAIKDKFDQQSNMYQFIQNVSQVRKAHKVLSRGQFEILADNSSGAGVLAYKRTSKNDNAVVLFNTASKPVLLSNMNTGLSKSDALSVIFSDNFGEKKLFSDASRLTMVLPPRSIAILKPIKNSQLSKNHQSKFKISIDDQVAGKMLTEHYRINGTFSLPNYPLLLIDNGEIESAISMVTDADGNWFADIHNSDYGKFEHSMVAFDPISLTASLSVKFTTSNQMADIQLTLKDPLGDDIGSSKNYRKPTDPGFRQQMDISQVDILAGGKTLQLTIHMAELKSDWVAANLFDHVAFTLFFDLPLTQGLNVLPKLNSQAPEGFDWDYGHQFFGWGNSMFGTDGADLKHFGSTEAKSPTLVVNTNENKITVTYDANQLGIESWLGSKIYITTWDLSGEGEYRPLSKSASRWDFSSPNANGAFILDDIGPILLKIKDNH
ncbi:MAG: alpha-amylase [Kangiella sp.]|nr:MAG: alpha-amylase [Kangiella sp.]